MSWSIQAAQDGGLAKTSLEKTNEFTVFGSVTDSGGRPLEGVQVRAYSGIGTLWCTGTAMTSSGGRYRLGFGPGVLVGSAAGGHGVGFQAATIFAQKDGYSCAGLGGAGNLAMTDIDPGAPEPLSGYSGIVRPYHPYPLDFVLLPAATIEGSVTPAKGGFPAKGVTLSLAGKILPPSSSVLCSTNLSDPGHFIFPDVPVGSNWWFEVSWRDADAWKSLRSKPFSCDSPAKYRAVITTDSSGKLNLSILR